jgi:hypothetical protein
MRDNEEVMKNLALAVLLLVSASAWAGTEPNAADYTINVHVNSSRLTDGDGSWIRLSVIMDGKKYELQGVPTRAMLAPGDYKARRVKDEHKTTYDSLRVYEFLFPDMKTRQYYLVGVAE